MTVSLQALKKANQTSEATFFVETRLPHVKLSLTSLPKSLVAALQKAMRDEAVDMGLGAAAVAPGAALEPAAPEPAAPAPVLAQPAAAAAAAADRPAQEPKDSSGIDFQDL